jgi:tetratricopeptide (TPR) repeat protein
MAKQKVNKEEVLVDVVEVTKDAQTWFERNGKMLMYLGIALVAIIAGNIAWKSYIAGQQKKAVSAMWRAEQMFERDSFALALNNPGGGFEGFQGIINKYGRTPAGNLARYYAGLCYLNLGKFDEAIKYLDEYSPADNITPTTKYGALGDAYSEKKDFAKALKNYKEAAHSGVVKDMKAIYLKRYGMLSENQNDINGALEAYNELKNDYSLTPEGRDIEKFIIRAESKKK